MIIFLVICGIIRNHFSQDNTPNPPDKCNVSLELKTEIASYSTIVSKIITSTTENGGRFRGKSWKELAYFVDTFGNRISGSVNLENSIDYMINLLKSYGLENVHGENVSVPHWVR